MHNITHQLEGFALALSDPTIGMWDWDIKAAVYYWSQQMRDFLGITNPNYAPAGLEGLLPRLHEEDRPRIKQALKQHLENRTPYQIDYRIIHEDGHYIWWRSRGQAQWDAEGHAIRMCGLVEDVTAEKEAEAQLDEMRERLDLAIAGSLVGVWDWQVEEDLLYWSDHTKAIFGVDPDFAPSQADFLQRVYKDDRLLVQEAMAKHLHHEADYDITFRILRPDGALAWLRARGQAAWHEDVPIRMTGSMDDITEQKTVMERYTLALQGAASGLWDWDVQNDHLFLSPKGKEILGYYALPDQLKYRFLEYLVPPVDRKMVATHVRGFLAQKHDFNLEYRIRTQSNEIRWIYNTAVGVWDKEGRILRVVGSFTDITRRKQAEEELSQYSEELEDKVEERTEKLQLLVDKLQHSNANLERFAFVASHDLREPIRTIASFSQLLERKYEYALDAQAKEILSHIMMGATRMESLVGNLLDYARIGSPSMNVELVDLNDVLKHVQSLLHRSIEMLKVQITHVTLPSIRGDRAQLSQLFQNLISNAIKYHKKKQKIRIHIEHNLRQNEHIITVEDNGIGIPQEHQLAIFDVFKRLHDNETYSGTGIGLATCRRVVENHGGRIWVDPEYKEGARFCIALPLK